MVSEHSESNQLVSEHSESNQLVSEHSESNQWFVYIIECKNKALYTGITSNIERRIKEHNLGKGGHYTKIHMPVELLWKEMHPNKSSALQRESQIKRWTRKKKKALIKLHSFGAAESFRTRFCGAKP